MNAQVPGSPRAVVTDDRPPSSHPAVDTAWLSTLAGNALVALEVPAPAVLAVTLVEVDEIERLNREHLDGSGPTDVLSFPMDGPEPPPWVGTGQPESAPWTLGDVIICPEVAAAQAPGHAGTLQDELALLCVHGILHLLGHDHAEAAEARRMRAAEDRVLRQVHRALTVGTEVPG